MRVGSAQGTPPPCPSPSQTHGEGPGPCKPAASCPKGLVGRQPAALPSQAAGDRKIRIIKISLSPRHPSTVSNQFGGVGEGVGNTEEHQRGSPCGLGSASGSGIWGGWALSNLRASQQAGYCLRTDGAGALRPSFCGSSRAGEAQSRAFVFLLKSLI